jgi:hypothetical protein
MISVCFNDNANQVIVFDSSTFGMDQNSDELWYAASDLNYFRRLQEEAFITVVPRSSEGTSCPRNHVKSVLSQQWEHERMGISDPRGLAKLSKVCSKAERQRAHQAAIENTREVYDVERLRQHCPLKANDGKRGGISRRNNPMISPSTPTMQFEARRSHTSAFSS